MKTKDLIKALEAYDPESEVAPAIFVADNGMDEGRRTSVSENTLSAL